MADSSISAELDTLHQELETWQDSLDVLFILWAASLVFFMQVWLPVTHCLAKTWFQPLSESEFLERSGTSRYK